jgi:hypothetical protein
MLRFYTRGLGLLFLFLFLSLLASCSSFGISSIAPPHPSSRRDGYARIASYKNSRRHTRSIQVHHPNTQLSSSSSSSSDNTNEIVHLDHIERVFCISDLHTDHGDNMKWLANRTSITETSTATTEAASVLLFGASDLVVVAGDISHDLERLEQSLVYLLQTGAAVMFVPGNHEAWLHSTELELGSSLEKLDRIYQICHKLGVLTTPSVLQVGGGTSLERPHALWIAPLESWYDGSLAIQGCEDLGDDGFGKWPWVDFIRCRWPGFASMERPNQKIPSGLTRYFADLNIPLLERLQEAVLDNYSLAQQQQPPSSSSGSRGVMTVSHFLPNKQCLPDWADVESPHFLRGEWLDHGGGEISAKFAKVAGTDLLEEQIRTLNRRLPEDCRQIHLFGHSHRPKDFEMHGIRYIHNPLGKPRERDMRMVAPDMEFQLVWDTRLGEITGETVIRYWEEKGGGVQALRERMENSKRKSRYGKHYKLRHHRTAETSTSSTSISRLGQKRHGSSSSSSSSSSSANSQ